MKGRVRQQCDRFLNNDEQLAKIYGQNPEFFRQNKAEIDSRHAVYRYIKLAETAEQSTDGSRLQLVIHNPHCLKIRPEKQIADILGLSRSQVKKLTDSGEIKTEVISPQLIAVYMDHSIF